MAYGQCALACGGQICSTSKYPDLPCPLSALAGDPCLSRFSAAVACLGRLRSHKKTTARQGLFSGAACRHADNTPRPAARWSQADAFGYRVRLCSAFLWMPSALAAAGHAFGAAIVPAAA